MRNKAIVWDYDGTLVDTRAKNFKVTKNIMRDLKGAASGEYPALRSLEHYIGATRRAKNWRELYKNEFGMNEAEIDNAGSLWTEYQLSDDSGSPLFDRIDEVIRSLSGYPHLIFSQNSRRHIARVLETKKLNDCFADIVGYEEVSSGKQKPAPDGLLLCLSRIVAHPCEKLFFIGDHEVDTLCGHNANAELAKSGSTTRVITIAAFYGSENDSSQWEAKPDHVVSDPREIPGCIELY